MPECDMQETTNDFWKFGDVEIEKNRLSYF